MRKLSTDAKCILALLAVVGLLMLACLILVVSPAQGHDNTRPELDGWFMGLRSKGKG